MSNALAEHGKVRILLLICILPMTLAQKLSLLTDSVLPITLAQQLSCLTDSERPWVRDPVGQRVFLPRYIWCGFTARPASIKKVLLVHMWFRADSATNLIKQGEGGVFKAGHMAQQLI